MKSIKAAAARAAHRLAPSSVSARSRIRFALLVSCAGSCWFVAWASSARAGSTPTSHGDTSAASAELSTLAQGCDQGEAVSCNDLGVSYLHGYSVPADARLAFAAFERACGLGSPDGCGNLGALYESGVGVGRSLEEAARLYERACGAGGALACSNLGALYARGRGVPRDLLEARRLFTLACQTGSAAGCNNLIQFAPPHT